MYKDIKASKTPSIYGNLKPVTVMKWISEIETIFETCGCSYRQKIVIAVRQLKIVMLSWWKLLANTMPKGEVIKMSWETFL